MQRLVPAFGRFSKVFHGRSCFPCCVDVVVTVVGVLDVVIVIVLVVNVGMGVCWLLLFFERFSSVLKINLKKRFWKSVFSQVFSKAF